MTNIQLTDLTVGTKELVNGEYVWNVASGLTPGVLDKLIAVVNDNIGIQYDNGRIKDDKYADVYLGSMQTVIAQSMQYMLQEKMVEAQIDGILKDNEVKNAQLQSIILDDALKAAQIIGMEYDNRIKEYNKVVAAIDVLSKELTLESDYPVDVTVNYAAGTTTAVMSTDPDRKGKVARLLELEELKVKLGKAPSLLK